MVRGPGERQGSQLGRCSAEGCKASPRGQSGHGRPSSGRSLRKPASTVRASAPGPGLSGAQRPCQVQELSHRRPAPPALTFVGAHRPADFPS